jgi:hypothetical protein
MFREMGKKGFISSALVYTCLIGGFSKVLSMDGSQWYMEEMINKGLTPTVVTYMDRIIGYFQNGDEKKNDVPQQYAPDSHCTGYHTSISILGFDNDGGGFC